MEEDIKLFNRILNIKDKEELYKNYFCWLYPFTNENINGYYSKINFNQKRVLSVTSSGDHILNAFLKGAYEVDAFDINPLAKYYAELKVAAVKTLNLKEFIFFFHNRSLFGSSKHFMDKNIYLKRISKELKGIYRKFWDEIFHNNDSKILQKSLLFTDDYLQLKGLIESNPYLDIYNYEKLREILKTKTINYYDISISDLPSLNKKYDVIILSNISDFLNDVYGKEELKNLRQTLEQIKKSNTRIVINYYYNSLIHTQERESSIYNFSEVEKHFSDYEYLSFESSNNLNGNKLIRKLVPTEDMVLISKEK